jgi:hypothetical protein
MEKANGRCSGLEVELKKSRSKFHHLKKRHHLYKTNSHNLSKSLTCRESGIKPGLTFIYGGLRLFES